MVVNNLLVRPYFLGGTGMGGGGPLMNSHDIGIHQGQGNLRLALFP